MQSFGEFGIDAASESSVDGSRSSARHGNVDCFPGFELQVELFVVSVCDQKARGCGSTIYRRSILGVKGADSPIGRCHVCIYEFTILIYHIA